MPTLLALDTATDRISLALVGPGATPRLHDAPGGAHASATLVPAILALLADAGMSVREVTAFAFGRGPGAFTGLRTAASVVQGLAFGAARPVLAIDSLMIVADDAAAQAGPGEIWVAMDARMDEVYAACYRRDAGRWDARVAPALFTLEALNAAWQADPPAVVAGSAVAAFGPRLLLGEARTVAHPRSRAAALGRLALEAWQRGEAVDAAQAQPLYLRDKVALTTAERLAKAA